MPSKTSQDTTGSQEEIHAEGTTPEAGREEAAPAAKATHREHAEVARSSTSTQAYSTAESKPGDTARGAGQDTSVDELSSAAMAPAAPWAEMMDETIAAPVPETGESPAAGASMAEALRLERTGGGAITRGVISGLQGVGDVEAQLVHTVRDMVGTTLKATGAAASDAITVVGDVVMQAIVTAEKLGTGVVLAARSIVKGAVLGVSDVGGDVLGAATIATRSTVRAAADRGANVGSTARQAVSGAAEAASETGRSVAGVTRAAVVGAFDAVRNVGGLALTGVALVLLGLARGLKGVAEFVSPESRAAPVQHTGAGSAISGGMTPAEAERPQDRAA